MTSHEQPGAVVKVIELVGSSPNSFSDAVRNAVKVASRTIRNIQGVEVYSSTADVGSDGELSNYKVQCKIAFVVEAATAATAGDAAGIARQLEFSEAPMPATGVAESPAGERPL